MIKVKIFVADTYTDPYVYNEIELFSDEKISVTSSIQNINDISKTFTDFSQTFKVPASKKNNKIFKHWYNNTNDNPFQVASRVDAYIEIDTKLFKTGKLQLESVNEKNGVPENYALTFIGLLGTLKDKFNGLYLKDLNSSYYNDEYTPNYVKSRVVGSNQSDRIMFPLISSLRYWNYGNSNDPTNNINNSSYPIVYSELFPALRLKTIFDIIETTFGIIFIGIGNVPFIDNEKFRNAYLYLKNAEKFAIPFSTLKANFLSNTNQADSGFTVDLNTDTLNKISVPRFPIINNNVYTYEAAFIIFRIKFFTYANILYNITIKKNGVDFINTNVAQSITSGGFITVASVNYNLAEYDKNDTYQMFVNGNSILSFETQIEFITKYRISIGNVTSFIFRKGMITCYSGQEISSDTLQIKNFMPEIKVEDFFTGILKMFNLTCFSTDGITFTVETLENYYLNGSDIDITKYVITDNKDLNRVKGYKKVNFDYEKGDSIINVSFNSANGIEYGSLKYQSDPPSDGAEYSIKLPFEDLNFQNLKDKLQVGYCVKTDLKPYIPKPIILYDYDSTNLTTLTNTIFYFSNGSNTIPHISYKAFGQETLLIENNTPVTYGLNFNEQQSTLTNEVVQNSLFKVYYQNYFNNIFNYKARLIKIKAILPLGILVNLKLNDNLIINESKYLINTMVTDLTTGVVDFELLTDQRL